MSIHDKSGDYRTPCPECGGVVHYWYWDCDCRGNPPSSGIQCKDCKKDFTQEEWEHIEKMVDSGEYELLSGDKFNLGDLDESERRVVEEFLRRVEEDPEGNDEGEYYTLYRLSYGSEALLIKYRGMLPPKKIHEPCYLILRDIVTRAGIRHGIVPDSEAEEKLISFNSKCTIHALTTAPDELGIKRSEVVRLLEKGELEGEKVGNIWFVYETSIQDYKRRLEDGKKK